MNQSNELNLAHTAIKSNYFAKQRPDSLFGNILSVYWDPSLVEKEQNHKSVLGRSKQDNK